MSAFIKTLASYVPGLIIHRLAANPTPIRTLFRRHLRLHCSD